MPLSTPPFTTTSQVHPGHLPTLYRTGRMEKKLATAAVAAIGIGYGLAKYKELKNEQEYANAESEAARRRQAEAMMDAYSDRASLAELEAAVAAYETQRRKN
ncbi:hypothetical protein GGR57DRAFT_296202 [Xylariaceae sp. FL1272]|nr:hypothetical protein GGR57DRAFT_296202 [Xylariaceae sp. FL1272]